MGDQTLALGRIFTRTTRTLVYIVVILVSCVFVRCGSSYQCPSMCQCEHAKTGMLVDCTGKNLSAVPPGLGPNTIKLGLSMNNITELPDRSFAHLPRLQSLHLANNRLSDLSPNALAGLAYLEYLTFQGNQFTSVPVQALRKLISLKTLYLDNNNISDVPDGSFRSLRNLEQLRLDFNQIREIPVIAINKARALVALDLEHNLIDNVLNQSFVNLTNLGLLYGQSEKPSMRKCCV